MSVDAIERAARCRRCRTKSIVSMQIIYVGSSGTALQDCETKQSDDNLDEIQVLNCSLFATLQGHYLQKCLKIEVSRNL